MDNYSVQGWIAGISFVVSLILYIVAIVLAFHFKRHYIAIGVISSFVVPLLLIRPGLGLAARLGAGRCGAGGVCRSSWYLLFVSLLVTRVPQLVARPVR